MAVLGIDETRRGKPIWAQDPVTGRWRIVHDRWHTAIVDAAGTAGLLAHIDGRTAASVTDWLATQPDSWKAGVTHVAIDLSASYAKAVRDALPDAVIVADKFHLVRPEQPDAHRGPPTRHPEVRGRRGRKKDPEWAARRRLLLGYERHTSASFTRMWNALIDAGDPGLEVLHAYTVKEQLRALLALPTTADRELIYHRLWKFYAQAAASDIPEAHRLAETIETWWPAVLAAITTGHSNARSEGYNRLAKHVGRDAFGLGGDLRLCGSRWQHNSQRRAADQSTYSMLASQNGPRSERRGPASGSRLLRAVRTLRTTRIRRMTPGPMITMNSAGKMHRRSGKTILTVTF